MRNIEELRNGLIGLYDKIKNGEIEHATAKELNNSAGKIINTAKVQLEYASLKKENPEIPFLECGKD